MVIDPNNIVGAGAGNAGKAKAAASSRAEAPTKVAEKAPKAAADSVSLSAQAQSMAKLEAALAEAPEVNSAKVEELRQAIASGQYRVQVEALAEKILSEDF